MSARELITEHLDLWTGAVTKKSSSGRGSNGKVELAGVKKLRELILGMAIQGKLTTREARDEPASDLLQRISARQAQLYTQGKIKKPKKLPSVSVEEQYFHLAENWEWTRLGTLFDSIMSGGTPSKQNPRFWGGDIPWASVKDLGKTKHLDKTQDYITEEGLKAGSKLADTGDVLICTRMGLGKVAICSKPIAINQDLKAVKISPEVSLDYFFLAYTTLDITGTGTTVAGITQDKLLNYVIGLPPIEEQHRIVQKVDELMALCDRLEQQTSDQLEAQETLVDTLLGTLTPSENATELADNWARVAAHFDTLFTTERSIDKLKQTILQLAVMGRLVEQDAGDDAATELLASIERRKHELVKAKHIKLPGITSEEALFDIPRNWQWVKFGELGLFINGDRSKNYPNKEEYVERGVAWINTGHIEPNGTLTRTHMHFITREKYDSLRSGKIEPTDLVYCLRGATFGKTAFVAPYEEGAIASSLMIIRPYLPMMRSYIYHYLVSPFGRSQIFRFDNGSAQPNLSANSVTMYAFPLPPLAEQGRIVEKVNELMALCDRLKERLNEASGTQCRLAEAVVEKSLG